MGGCIGECIGDTVLVLVSRSNTLLFLLGYCDWEREWEGPGNERLRWVIIEAFFFDYG